MHCRQGSCVGVGGRDQQLGVGCNNNVCFGNVKTAGPEVEGNNGVFKQMVTRLVILTM